MKHTDDDVLTAIEYAALLLEQLDAGGSLPEYLRQHAEHIQTQRKNTTKLFSLLEECQELIEHLLETQQTVGPMSEKGYQEAMKQIGRIKQKTARLKEGLGVE